MNSVSVVSFFTGAVTAARDFYAELLGVAPVAEWPGGAVFAMGDAKLLVHERAAAMEDGFLAEPQAYPWGRSAYLRDSDGGLVQLSVASS